MFSPMARRAFQAPLSPMDWDLLLRQADMPSEQELQGDYLLGLTVGQGLQPSGIAVLERLAPSRRGEPRSYACRYLRRLRPPAPTYPSPASDLRAMLRNPPLPATALHAN